MSCGPGGEWSPGREAAIVVIGRVRVPGTGSWPLGRLALVGPAGSERRAQPLAGGLLEQVDRDDGVRPEVALGKERPRALALGSGYLLDDFLGAGGSPGRRAERADLQQVPLAQANENDVHGSRWRLSLRAHGRRRHLELLGWSCGRGLERLLDQRRGLNDLRLRNRGGRWERRCLDALHRSLE